MLSIDWVGLHNVKFLKEKLQAQVEGVKGLSTEDFFFFFQIMWSKWHPSQCHVLDSTDYKKCTKNAPKTHGTIMGH